MRYRRYNPWCICIGILDTFWKYLPQPGGTICCMHMHNFRLLRSFSFTWWCTPNLNFDFSHPNANTILPTANVTTKIGMIFMLDSSRYVDKMSVLGTKMTIYREGLIARYVCSFSFQEEITTQTPNSVWFKVSPVPMCWWVSGPGLRRRFQWPGWGGSKMTLSWQWRRAGRQDQTAIKQNIIF